MKKLRREVEILRAQVRGTEKAKVADATTATQNNPSAASVAFETSTHVREDLRRSLLITAAILALIGGLALSRSYWSG